MYVHLVGPHRCNFVASVMYTPVLAKCTSKSTEVVKNTTTRAAKDFPPGSHLHGHALPPSQTRLSYLYVERPSSTIAGRHRDTLNDADDPVAAQTRSPVHKTDRAVAAARMAGRRTLWCHRYAAPSLAGRRPCLPRDSDLFVNEHQRRWGAHDNGKRQRFCYRATLLISGVLSFDRRGSAMCM